MHRRNFLLRLSTLVPMSVIGQIAPPSQSVHASESVRACESPPSGEWRTFEITTSIEVAKPNGKTSLWVPIPWRQNTDYQHSLATRWEAPDAASAELLTLEPYDVALLRVEWPDSKSVRPITLTNQVRTRDRRVELHGSAAGGACESALTLQKYLQPTSFLPTDGIVKDTAVSITRGSHGDLERARAIYEWVVDHTNRDPKTPGCGLGDVASMLKSGYLGGKCADINGLFVALARAVNIPARDAYGLRVANSRLGFQCLGRSGDVSKAQHCRAEFYTQTLGWVPVDPADVRKVVLEEVPGGLSVADPRVQAARAALFGSWEMNWVAYNHGHDVSLPGAHSDAIPFLMYPNAQTADGRFDGLDPSTFRYQINSRELDV